MQHIALCFCATLGVLLTISSFVDAQEIVYVSDADINPVETVSLAQAFIQTVLKSDQLASVEAGVSVPDSISR
jgi:hypothetical protein